MVLRNESSERYFSDLISVDKILRAFDQRSCPVLIHLSDAEFEVIGRDDPLEYLRDQPELCFRLTVTLSRLYQQAIETIKSH